MIFFYSKSFLESLWLPLALASYGVLLIICPGKCWLSRTPSSSLCRSTVKTQLFYPGYFPTLLVLGGLKWNDTGYLKINHEFLGDYIWICSWHIIVKMYRYEDMNKCLYFWMTKSGISRYLFKIPSWTGVIFLEV